MPPKPVTLGSLLHTHPYKKVNSLQHISAKLKLPTVGTVDVMRDNIMDYVGNDASLESMVKDIAIRFRQVTFAKTKTKPCFGLEYTHCLAFK